ncbi:hypothetical protein IFM89_014341, partial [Coptis chinensis]
MVTRANKWELDEIWKEPTLGLIFGDEFKDKKSKWKRNFYTRCATYEERISHRLEQQSQQEWVQLMEFWDTPEHQAISKRNRANHAKQIAEHAAGRISFPQFEEIMEAGATPSLGALYVRTHTSLQTHDDLDDQLREYIVYEIYREVMPPERHGCVMLKGRGVTQTSYFGSRLSSDNHVNDLESQLAEMQRVAQEKEEERRLEIEEVKRQAQEKDEQRQHEIDEMNRQLDALDADMETRLMQKVVNFSQMVSR